jgi:pectin methylesterase-like acyl-CoA thioesterase
MLKPGFNRERSDHGLIFSGRLSMKARYGIGGTIARAAAVALLLIAIGGSKASANFGGPPPTEYVGTCKKGSFATIGAAITASPAGATILVCPGIYPEQLTINKPLTIEGIQSGNNDAAIITGTSAVNAADFDAGGSPIITQILVENTSKCEFDQSDHRRFKQYDQRMWNRSDRNPVPKCLRHHQFGRSAQ